MMNGGDDCSRMKAFLPLAAFGEELSLMSISSSSMLEGNMIALDFIEDIVVDSCVASLVGVRWMAGSKSPSNSGDGRGRASDGI